MTTTTPTPTTADTDAHHAVLGTQGDSLHRQLECEHDVSRGPPPRPAVVGAAVVVLLVSLGFVVSMMATRDYEILTNTELGEMISAKFSAICACVHTATNRQFDVFVHFVHVMYDIAMARNASSVPVINASAVECAYF